MKRFIKVVVNGIAPTLKKVDRHQQMLSDLPPLVNKNTEDNTQIILPLSAFIDNRSQMVEEMFASLSREELRQLLPDSLTHIQRAELMDLCTDELEGMSKKRITAVLEGRQLMESSDSEESALLDSNEQLSSQTEVDAVHADSSTNVHAELDDTLLNIPNEFTSSETLWMGDPFCPHLCPANILVGLHAARDHSRET
uniref:Schwannomin interacting protein 1 C-terminal domain-containing protein n=1 Tax=Ascaris lumbricoides TaxID=6252 RepID=A0A9J2P214_ASCLU